MHLLSTKNSLIALVAALVPLSSAFADVNAVTPSTNDINRTNGWAHVDQIGVGPGVTDLSFISTRAFASCFEYRTDGDTSQIISTNGGVNYNPAVLDGLYPYHCQNNSSTTYTVPANEYVEVRMVFGAEADERFDWTRFDVTPLPKYSCVGFAPPADDDLFVKKPNRVVPLRMSLKDGDGIAVWDIAPPVVNVSYKASPDDTAEVIDELTFVGRGDEGNMFLFDGSNWAFNITLKSMAKGEYTITAVPGGDYAFDPTCEVVVTIQ